MFFWYNCKSYCSETALGKKSLSKYICQLEIDHLTQQPKETCQRIFRGHLEDLKWTFFLFFQVDALRWRALAQQAKDESQRIHFKVLFEALKGLEKQWDKDLLSCEEVGNILTSCSY